MVSAATKEQVRKFETTPQTLQCEFRRILNVNKAKSGLKELGRGYYYYVRAMQIMEGFLPVLQRPLVLPKLTDRPWTHVGDLS